MRNRAIDARRSRVALKCPSEEQLPGVELGDKGPSLVDTLIEHEERDAHLGPLMQLPAAEAEVIALAYFGEMSHTEISAQLGLPPGTVKGRMRLGMEKLRARMEVAA